MLNLLRKCFPEEVRAATKFEFATAEAFAKPNCKRCFGKGWTQVIRPDGSSQFNYCSKSLCSEYRLSKVNKLSSDG